MSLALKADSFFGRVKRLIPLSQVTVTRGLAGVLRANMAR